MAADEIKTVHVVFKTHLDIGFTALAREVKQQYFDEYIPRALRLARESRIAPPSGAAGDRFIWTTGAWLIYEYLEQATPDQRREMENAIAAGDVAWHGLPFTTHTELYDTSLFAANLEMSKELDRRYGRTTIAAKLTDVPGHTRGLVPLLEGAGIKFLHIGVNPASTVPDIPDAFVWRDPGGSEVVVAYSKGSYGKAVTIPGCDEALVFAHTPDNVGPPRNAQEIADVFAEVRKQFPGARVVASTMDGFAAAISQIKPSLPVVTAELADTWIHGVASDPKKLAQFRELSRLRREWLVANPTDEDRQRIAAFSRSLSLVAEHTWGVDIKRTLGNSQEYSAADFQAARNKPSFKRMEESWNEQRRYIDDAIAELDPVRAKQARDRLATLDPVRPDRTGFTHLPVGSRSIETDSLMLHINDQTGAIDFLKDKTTGRVWAGDDAQLGMLRYQTFGQEDYDNLWQKYMINKLTTRHWSRGDFTKPGIEAAGAVKKWWVPRVTGVSAKQEPDGVRLLIDLALDKDACERFGAPAEATIEVTVSNAKPELDFTLQWFDKHASRLPEALWMSFTPLVDRRGSWQMDKLGEAISPRDVIRNGNRQLHAVNRGVTYADTQGGLTLETKDAALVAPGGPGLLDFKNRQPRPADGMHFNLFNNVWGTNFRMWYDEDAKFRFKLNLSDGASLT